MSRGMPCQNTMESSPATLKISEKAMKYHFLPRKSMFALLKNSTLLKPLQPLSFRRRPLKRAGEEPYVNLQTDAVCQRRKLYRPAVPTELYPRPRKCARIVGSSDTQSLAHALAAQNPVKNHSRHKDRGEQICKEPKAQRHRKTAHRARAEKKKNDRRNNSCDVGIHDRDPGMAKALLHC